MDIELISTDFDGTLVEDGHPVPFHPDLAETIRELREAGALWAINTGRSLWHLVEGLRGVRFPFSPDFILTNEREIYRPTAEHSDHDGWEDFGEWNRRCEDEHRSLYVEAGAFFREIADFAVGRGVKVVRDEEAVEGLITRSEEEMDFVVAHIESLRRDQPKVSYQRNSVYLRFCHVDYNKGTALGELSRLLELGPESVFAAGDNYNDLSMLDGRYANMAACPGNSVETVKELVRENGGYVADGHASEGVAEALRFFQSNGTALRCA